MVIHSEGVQAHRESLPRDRDALLGRAGPGRAKIYALVRQILDELEAAAPWKDLYYPPRDAAALIAMAVSVLRIIDDAPSRIGEAKQDLGTAASEESAAELFDEAGYFLDVIRASVEPEITSLRSKLEASAEVSGTGALTSEERDALCELTADLKGKYSSSIMGVATSLVLKDLGGGPEVESVLFPERAEEVERSHLLVETLSEVIEDITSLLREVPLAELVEQWRLERRVDLYALTPLYQLLGNLGKLMKEKSRRAIYSGDFHQIRKRERLLDARISELATLHNKVWETDSKPAGVDSSHYSLMVQKATELAAILDLNILKSIVGEEEVEKLHAVVAHEKVSAEDVAAPGSGALPESIPHRLRPLIPLLYTEDLQTFLGLLLGSVLKRTSLAREREEREAVAPAAEPAAAGAAGGAGDEVLSPLGPEIDSVLAAETVAGAGAPETVSAAPRKAEGLSEVREVLEGLRSHSNVHRMSYELVRRLLEQGKAVPREMMESLLPYVHDVRDRLLPLLQGPDLPPDVPAGHAAELHQCCTFLGESDLTADRIRAQVPGIMEKLLRLLDELRAADRASAR